MPHSFKPYYCLGSICDFGSALKTGHDVIALRRRSQLGGQ